MRIVRLTAENVKKLVAVEITPAGTLVQVTGPNGSGKSSVLDSIYYALAGKGTVPTAVVRRGAQHARVKVDLGEIVVTRKFEADGKTTLTVESAEGARFPSPQAMLDKLVGPLTFDPLEFSRLDPRGQLERLRGLVTLAEDVDVLDGLNRRDFESRAAVNRDLKQATGALAAIPDSSDGTPDQPVSVATLLDEIESAITFNGEVERETRYRAGRLQEIRDLRDEAVRLRAEAEEAEQSANDARAQLDRLAPLADLLDVSDLRRQVDAATVVNEQVRLKRERAAAEGRVATLRAESETLTAAMDARVARKQAVITAAEMPVDGLGFGEGEVTYHGLPLANASSAEQLRVSVAIAMAGNPELRVLRIKDGSLLDDENLALLAEMAEAQDYQIWIERVDTRGSVGIVMHDGAQAPAEEA